MNLYICALAIAKSGRKNLEKCKWKSIRHSSFELKMSNRILPRFEFVGVFDAREIFDAHNYSLFDKMFRLTGHSFSIYDSKLDPYFRDFQ